MPPRLMWADDERGIPRRIARTRAVAACAGDASRACGYHGQPMGARVGTGAAICGSLPRAATRARGNQSAVARCWACEAGGEGTGGGSCRGAAPALGRIVGEQCATCYVTVKMPFSGHNHKDRCRALLVG